MERVAVIGLGNIAIRHRRNLKCLYPDSTLYAMSASGRIPDESVENCDQVVSDVQMLIDAGVQLVIVASPAPFHARHAIPFIKAGIPVLIEKPIAASSEDAQAIADAVNQYQTPAGVGYCLRYLPSSRRIRELLRSGTIGHLYNVFIETGQYLPDWRPAKDFRESVSANAHLGGGALLELSHELDYCQWLLGALDVRHAILRSSDELSLSVEDSADIISMTQHQAVVNIHLDFLQRKARRKCRITGSQGALDWDLIRNEVTLSSADGGCEIIYSEPEWDKNLMYLNMLKAFIQQITDPQTEPENLASVEDAVKTVRLIEQIKQVAD
ncbi:putative oxidoreductase YcjS [Vibrio aerogenes CECT 7868]|uniref:Putative oxidoreductase YcjS n=1 Tax=Vibrio aerogenes CECT 7868 TaxID=1216006 RepID=A0A1M5ZD88_9VIBR|nr:Gfo/Idh/MocA family oxidoreductase [Vibrio aerogenes]SHI22168.1 putative oxidoreductase YcjS [Vibrio aerogenes CECT 7868]